MKFPFSISLLCAFSIFINAVDAQPGQDEVCKIAHFEAKAAGQKMQFKSHGLASHFDVVYQRMHWTVNPSQRFISGSVHTRFEALSKVERLYFDLHFALKVDSVVGQGRRLNFVHRTDHILDIELPAAVAEGEIDSVQVYYSGVPPTSGFGSFEQSNHMGNGIIWTLSQPYGARDWWPCKQDLKDKIDSVDIFITIPLGNKAASNGSLESVESLPNRSLRYHWKHRYPIPAYLVAFAVTNYVEFSHFANLSEGQLQVLNYVYPEDFASLAPGAQKVIPLLELFDTLIGPYPYMNEKYGHAQFGWGGGMEHTTMSFMGSMAYELVAHELAHQWFGNKITCGSWQDIWLNEGFATYLTGLTYSFLPDPWLWNRWKTVNIERVTSQPGGSVFVEDTTEVGRIFSGRLSYSKGALLLHMLRWKLGDRDFYQAVRNYISDPELAYGFARTQDFKRHLEQQHGAPLNEFFADWFFSEGYPTYILDWAQDDDLLRVKIRQNTSHPSVDFFEMPVPVRFSGQGQDTLLVFEHGYSGQLFSRELPFQVENVKFDPDQWLVARLAGITRNSGIFGEDPLPAVFPNPAREKVKLLGHWEGLVIADERGQVVRHIRKQNASDDLVELDLRALRAGTYFLRFDGNKVQELVVVP